MSMSPCSFVAHPLLPAPLGSRFRGNDEQEDRNHEVGTGSGWGGSAPEDAEGVSIVYLAFVAE